MSLYRVRRHKVVVLSDVKVVRQRISGSSVRFMGGHERRVVDMTRKCLQGTFCQAGSLRSLY